ncbi:MAG: DegT/DnrJ/EryC1/StrS family aminotransferase [Elusimicrobia bacterium]|nr:DegT/DnrJ/EryC1/StrS family aminotransferase [Elusimicrobiota bacterium]
MTNSRVEAPPSVPMLDLNVQHRVLRAELDAAIARVMDHGHFINGPEVSAFESAAAAYCKVKHAVGVSSGTDALLIALMAINIKPGDEVITSTYSFFATAGAIVRLGAKPVFVDIDPSTFNIDPNGIAQAVTPRTRAIIPVHLFGQCADMAPILDIARRHGLRVVEDAAQAIGAEYKNGMKAGSMGDIGCFSFFPSKNLGALGDAGMVVTNDADLAERLRILRNHGSKTKYYHKFIGGNFRLDTLHAAILLVKIKHLDEWTQKRQQNARRYEDLFAKSGLKDVILPKAVYQSSGTRHYHIYNQFVIQVSERDRLQQRLRAEGNSWEVYYPVPFHLQECFNKLGYKRGDFPLSEKVSADSLAIPVFPELTPAQQEAVVLSLSRATRG